MNTLKKYSLLLLIILQIISCKTINPVNPLPNKALPNNFYTSKKDSIDNANINWRDFFDDKQLNNLIDKALVNNQEMNIYLQEIEISKNEVKEKKGEYLPKIAIGAGIGVNKTSENTTEGLIDKLIEDSGRENPEIELGFDANVSWEVDIWKKLRNAKGAAVSRLLSTKEGKNLLTTKLISEIANSYYELMANDNLIKILNENIKIQEEAFNKMKILKENAKANQLAVNRFQAQLLNTKDQKFSINQKIIELENRLKFLTGKTVSAIERNSDKMMNLETNLLQENVPINLLENRPDIKQAEYVVKASQLDFKSAKTNLYPKLDINNSIGFRAFNPALLLNPNSLVYNLAGNLVAPLINRNAIIARINVANAKQTQALLNYQQIVLIAYTEVLNQISKIDNAKNSFEIKRDEVKILNESIDIANSLFLYTRADYIEVLLTQEEYLKESMELVESKLKLISSKVNLYRNLGGGWN